MVHVTSSVSVVRRFIVNMQTFIFVILFECTWKQSFNYNGFLLLRHLLWMNEHIFKSSNWFSILVPRMYVHLLELIIVLNTDKHADILSRGGQNSNFVYKKFK